MSTKPINTRGPRPLKILWKWAAVSAALHAFLIVLMCIISYYSHQKTIAAIAARDTAEEVAAEKAEAERTANIPPPAPTPPPEPTPPPVQAEHVLGIDQVATPDEIPSSPFASGDEDLLKELR